MKRVFLQYWEESERGWGVRPDGCSLHLTMGEHKKYIEKIYESRDSRNIPDEYDRTVGEVIDVFVKDDLYDAIKGSLRLWKHELNNLLKLEEITII